ncbi:hypothetical protein ACW9UR_07895 [Halovulum sp. GXIMD14794]
MVEAVSPDARRFLVVTRKPVLALDLQEMLSGLDGARAEVAATLDAPWEGPFDVAFLGAPVAELVTHPKVQALATAGTRIVVLGGDPHAQDYARTGFHPLEQPFRSEEVEALLRDFGLLAGEV